MNLSIAKKWVGPAMATILLLSGCSKVLDFRNAEIAHNKIYQAGANTPFSGKLTNISIFKIPAGDVLQFMKVISTVTKDNGFNELLMTGAVSGVISNGGTFLCDVGVTEGMLDGDAICKLANLDMPLFKMPYKDGRLDGKALIYDFRKKDSVVGEFPFISGNLEGTSLIYSPKTGKVVHKAIWRNGKANGAEEIFDANSGTVIFRANMVDNRYEGEAITYDVNGKETDKKIFKGGQVQQVEQEPAPTPIPAEPTAAENACAAEWLEAFRKEQGLEALVRADQMEEWEGLCKEGKRPKK